LAAAELDARQAKEQVAALQYSTNVVHEVIKVVSIGAMSPVGLSLLDANFGVSGSMATMASNLFEASGNPAQRAFYASQIQSTLSNGLSAYIVTLSGKDLIVAEPIAAQLYSYREELLSAEGTLAQKLRRYGDHLNRMLAGALESYMDATNPLRYANAATNLRELMREFLAKVAPDEETKLRYDFEPDPTSHMGGVTRKHRISYAIYGALPRALFPEQFVDDADAMAEELSADINRLSKFTHVTAGILEKDETDAAPILAAVLQRFIQLIEAIEKGKQLAFEKLTLLIHESLDRLFTEGIFDDLDTLSSHTRPQDVDDVEVKIESVDDEWIHFTGTGSVNCDLQWGSDSDVSKGDGAEGSMSFPFTFAGQAPTNDPTSVKVERDQIQIDISEFYE